MNDLPSRDVEIFSAAIEMPAAERTAYLDQACQGDVELRDRVEALLNEHGELGDFLEKSPSKGVTQGPGIVESKPGDRIGRYKLVKLLGEGGCGVVYMAEQEEPVRRRVALKIIKPGMDTKSVIARFEAERQALTMMDHPNIAHVLDAGSTESRRPYFVMELVEGVRITDYCDQRCLPTTERLKLMIQVCDAIQHAHQKGIIHRDIKPSNILVTAGSDGKPVPKVIDFGIAKATTGQELTDKTIFTAFEMLIGTPAYMSPEQAALTSSDVDTRTDIYSLGVLLYELLTGTTPFDARKLLKAGLDEVRRVIRDEAPVRPSRRLTTMVATDLANVSVRCGAEAERLIRQLRGDLDWIVMKSLEKDRGRRYQTANALAGDVQRYLINETVSARPPSHLYQFRKLISRHKIEFAALGIVMATLVAALTITTWSLNKEKRAHREALTEVTRSRQTVELLNNLVMNIGTKSGSHKVHMAIPEVDHETAARLRKMLDEAAPQLETQLTNQPIMQADVEVSIGKVYGALGLVDKEESMINAALTLYGKSPDVERKVASARSALSDIYARSGKRVQAAREARKALAVLNNQETMEVVDLQARVARGEILEGRAVEGELLLRRALGTGQRLGETPTRLLEINRLLAMALGAQGQLTNAESLARRCLAMAEVRYGSNSVAVAESMALLTPLQLQQHKFAEAEDFGRQCVGILRKNRPNQPVLEEVLSGLGRALHEQGKNVEAADVYREALELRRKLYGEQEARMLNTVDSAEGPHVYSEVLELRRKLYREQSARATDNADSAENP